MSGLLDNHTTLPELISVKFIDICCYKACTHGSVTSIGNFLYISIFWWKCVRMFIADEFKNQAKVYIQSFLVILLW